ncbi:MAG: SET domain-containing protein-lysine N-methyltransferase [Bacteroidota bacterium]|nr:SET domain-containing protein-lysine N-methyltransferase [Odoribacter sp.]MDP3642488.1 SET domain-containing protein-lysine N-methyltransferase [Bacteroidota bacterium]
MNTIATDRDFSLVKTSPVHGRGVFAKRTIPKGTRVFEYAGLRVSKTDLETDLTNGLTTMTFVMNLNKTTAIDGERGGNDARFINHSCNPNCEVLYFNETPYIYAMQEIQEGHELNFDYKLGFDSETILSIDQKKEWFPCNCGSENCRGTLVSN